VILDTESDRLLVISDLHLGNPASTAEKRVLGFLDYAASIGASVCINGDGFDVLQMSFGRLVSAGLPVLTRLRHVQAAGGRVHYVVGNHDIVFEHFLDNVLGTLEMSPFLNVRSGGRFIRVEHGHLYDPFFARFPRLYGASTRLLGVALRMNRDLYRAWTSVSDSWDGRQRRRHAHDHPARHSYCYESAELLLERGFDAVVFGHTHNAEVVDLPSGRYVNSGDWLSGQTYVDIDHGEVILRTWDPALAPSA
jgi:UDP-2,3-diacylglucosamine pyrophosphatase LpxH